MAEHPITPPPEMVTSLRNSAPHGIGDTGLTRELWLINHAYAAGADQELEACCEQLRTLGTGQQTIDRLRAARRPKPPSLKEQALARLTSLEELAESMGHSPDDTIRRALEQLND